MQKAPSSSIIRNFVSRRRKAFGSTKASTIAAGTFDRVVVGMAACTSTKRRCDRAVTET